MRTDIPAGWAEAIKTGGKRPLTVYGPVTAGKETPYLPRFIGGGSLTRKLFDKPSIGNAACAILKLQTIRPLDDEGFPTEIRPVQELRPSVSLSDTGEITLGIGTFFTATRPKKRDTGDESYTAYDRMIFAEAPYVDQIGTYPMPAKQVEAYIAEQLGVEVDERSEVGDFNVDSPTGVYTMREVLRFIAAGSGGNYIIGSNGKLRCVPFGFPGESEEEPCSELDYADDLVITGVRLLPDSDTQYFSGDETGFVIEGECAYATQDLCDTVAAKLIGKVYRAFEAEEVRLDPAAELGDSIRLGGQDFVLASISYEFTLAMAATVGAPWGEAVENQIPYQSRDRETRMNARSFSEIRKSTEEIALEVKGKVDGKEVGSLISAGLNGIQLSAESGENKCTITLTGEGLDAKRVVAQFAKIIADSVSASNVTAGTLQADEINTAGSFNVGFGVDGDFEPTGHMGAGFGADAEGNSTYGVVLAAAKSNSYGAGDVYVIVTDGGARLQAGSNRAVVTPKNISLTAENGDVLVNGVPVGQAVFG